MRKLFVLLALLISCDYGLMDATEPEYDVQFVIVTNDQIVTSGSYQIDDKNRQFEMNDNRWESDIIVVGRGEFYYRIEFEAVESIGWVYIVINNEIHDRSYIPIGMDNVFSGYISDNNVDLELDLEL